MKRLFASLTVLAALAALNPAHAEDEAKPIVLKLATIAPDGTPWSEQMNGWKKKVEKRTDGKVKLKTYMGGTLGDEKVTVKETRRGAIQIFGGSAAALATSVPELGVLELPYLFRSLDEADYILDEVIYDDISKLLEERGFKMLFWAENGWRSLATSYGFVKSPADLKGKKMRSQESDVHLEMYRAFGASPVPISATEVLSSLQTGVVDGFDNTPLFAFASSWYQGVTHFTVNRHIYQPGIVVMSKKTWNELPKDVQDALMVDLSAEAKIGRDGVRALSPLLIQNFRNAKIGVYEPTKDELKAFADAAKPVHEWFRKNKGKKAAALLAKIEKALAEYRAKK